MWMRFQHGMFCQYCNNGWYIWSKNFIFYECPVCNGTWLGCDCDHGLCAVPREQTSAGAWVMFSEPDERGCVEITNLPHNEAYCVQAI
jgi:hypothetical protein